jgi:hypothetical protein
MAGWRQAQCPATSGSGDCAGRGGGGGRQPHRCGEYIFKFFEQQQHEVVRGQGMNLGPITVCGHALPLHMVIVAPIAEARLVEVPQN